ncbi:MAG TPA: hypothetical protein VGM77_13915 [Gemmatimonadales bacterium]|jgi:ABC-type enterochelin transport system permease subunit
MLARVARVLLRVAGWVLTPLVLVCAAAIGATIGLVVAPRFSPMAGLIVTAVLALAAAIAGLLLWLELLREHPELRESLAITAAGIPDADAVQRLVHPEGE